MTAESNPVPQIFEEASDWFVRCRLGDMETGDREAFNAWLCRSPDHIRAYLQIAQTYADVPALHDRMPIDPEQLVAAARENLNVVRIDRAASARHPVSPSIQRAGRSLPGRPLLAVAAGIVLTVLGLVGYRAVDAYRSPTYETATGEQRSIALPDGSTVALNAQSRIRIRWTEQRRRIDLLAGQALFQVAKDRNRPFVVYSDNMVIRAVGTEFDVYRRSNGTTVTVIEGRVAMREAAADVSEVYVSAGEQLIVQAGAVPALPRKAKPNAAIAWTQRRLVFEGTSLPEVVAEFNRYNTRQLVIRGGDLSDLHISGIYSSTDPASLVRFLKAEFGLAIREEPDRIAIQRQ